MFSKRKTLTELMRDRAESHADTPLYSFLNRNGEVAQTLTHADNYKAARSVSAMLQRNRITDCVVVLLYPHGPDFIKAFWGALLAGCYPVPLNRPRHGCWDPVRRIVRKSCAPVILTTASLAEKTRQQMCMPGLLTIGTDDPGVACCEDDDSFGNIRTNSSDVAFVQYTSGSTSDPKGVAVTHANVLDNSALIRSSFGCTENDTGVSWLPFHHDMGLIGHVIQPVYSSLHNYFLAPMEFAANPLRWLSAMSQYQGTISGAPAFAYRLCERLCEQQCEELDLSAWRLAYCGSETITRQTFKGFLRKFSARGFRPEAVFPCYGLAEATLYVCGRAGLRIAECPGLTESSLKNAVSVGRPGEDCELRIVNPEDCRSLPEEAVGEIWVRSASVARGYYNDQSASAEVFLQCPVSPAAQDGTYLRTGDLGFVSGGELFLVGRLKNLIKRHGRNFYAEDIEAVAMEAISGRGFLRCAAFAGDQDRLILVFEHDGRTRLGERASFESKIRTALGQSPGIVPEDILLTERGCLPLTTSGKLKRAECKRRLARGTLSLLAPRRPYVDEIRKETEHE